MSNSDKFFNDFKDVIDHPKKIYNEAYGANWTKSYRMYAIIYS